MAARSHFYFNLHKHLWSEMLRGKVIEHHTEVLLADVRFNVRPAGHAKVIKEKRKNVHAFAIAEESTSSGFTIDTFLNSMDDSVDTHWIELSYNPYKGANFFRKDTGERVDSASTVYLTDEKTIWAIEPKKDN